MPSLCPRGWYFVIDNLSAEVTSPANWKKSIIVNALGAIATFVVLCVFILTKFIHGAWIVVVIISLLALMFRSIHKHYVMVAKQLSTESLEQPHDIKNTVIVPISGIHRGVINALQWGGESVGQTECLRVFVGQLRKKIEPEPATPRHILTEPRIGHRFDPVS